jgi:DNA-binding transcriptional LysR family regulator
MQPLSVDLNLLPVLRMILEEGQVTRAAERLNLSVPATSRALDRARRTFDDPLLVRMGRGLTPTPRAMQLLPELVSALTSLENLLDTNDRFDPARLTKTFRIRANEVVSATLAGPLVDVVAGQAPSVGIRFETETSTDMDDLRGGEVSAGIGSYSDLTSDVSTLPLTRETMVAVLRSGHPLGGRRSLSIKAFADLDHVVVSRHGRSRNEIDAALDVAGHRRRIRVVMPSFTSALAMVAQSDTITVAPQTLVSALQSGFRSFRLPVPMPTVAIDLVWHHRYTSDPAHRWLRSCVTEAVSAAKLEG